MQDEIGNELYEGDLVVLKMGSEMMRGKVVLIEDSGLTSPGKAQQASARVTVQFQVTLAFPPRTRAVNVLKIVDPEATGTALKVMSGKSN
jgi:hypothetical protein